MSGEPSSQLQLVSALFRRIAAEHGFRVLFERAHNHGSLEWVAAEHGGIGRWIAFALTPDPGSVPANGTMRAEVWAGADQQLRYARRVLVSHFKVKPAALDPDSPVSRSFESTLRHRLEQGFERVARFEERDLTEERIQPLRHLS